MKILQIGMMLLLGIVTFAPTSRATMLAPGGTLTPAYQNFAVSDFGAVQADTTVKSFTGTDASNNTRFTGNLRELVVTDAVTNFLDFIYQIQWTGGPDNIGRFTTINYAPYSTDVGVCSACTDLISGADVKIDPANIGRALNGQQISFNYGDPNNPDLGGEAGGLGTKTSVLVIKTNSTTFAVGSTSIIDGGDTHVLTYDPTPEPMSAGLFLGGLFGAGLLLARRLQVRQE